MTKKYGLVIFIIIMLQLQGLNQVTSLKYKIFLDVSRGYLLYSFNQVDSTVITGYSTEESKVIKVFDLDKKGTLKFSISDSSRNEFIKGQYFGTSLIKNVSKIKRDRFRVTTGWDHPTTDKYYYRPVKDGEWFYYDINGEVTKSIKYNKGKLQ